MRYIHVCRATGRLEAGRDNGTTDRQRVGGIGETAGGRGFSPGG
jgi:hypothetical protein